MKAKSAETVQEGPEGDAGPLADPAGILAARGRDVLRARRRAARRGDPAAIHDVRVATRRLQTTLDLFAARLPEHERRRLDRRARKIRRRLGARRNAWVLLGLAEGFRSRVERGVRSFVDDLIRSLKRSAGKRGDRERQTLPGIRKRIQALLRAVRELPPGPSGSVEAALQGPRQAVLRARKAAHGADPESMHRVRIAVKRYRYTLEVLAHTGARGLAPAMREARALQRELGKLHDLDVLIELVRSRSYRGGAVGFLTFLRRRRGRQADTVLRRLAAFRPARTGGIPSPAPHAADHGRTAA